MADEYRFVYSGDGKQLKIKLVDQGDGTYAEAVDASGTGTGADQIQGTAADNAAVVGNPVLTAGRYNSSAPTYDNGDATTLQTDVNGNLKVTQATLIAGEDLTAGVLKTEQRFTYSMVQSDTAVKSGAGFLHTLTFSCNDAAPTAGSIIVYDNTAESGTVIFNHTFTTTPFMPFSVFINATFATGLYVGFTTTNDVNVTVSYR